MMALTVRGTSGVRIVSTGTNPLEAASTDEIRLIVDTYTRLDTGGASTVTFFTTNASSQTVVHPLAATGERTYEAKIPASDLSTHGPISFEVAAFDVDGNALPLITATTDGSAVVRGM